MKLLGQRHQRAACCFSAFPRPWVASYLAGLKEQLPLVHHNLVGVGQGGPEGEDVLILEDFQRLPLPALVHGHGVGADAQPEVLGKAAFLALWGQESVRGQIRKQLEAQYPESTVQAVRRALCTEY